MNSNTRQDIIPLCDKHHWPMTLREFPDGTGAAGMTFDVCTSAGCTRAYDNTNGYFNLKQGRVLLDKCGQQRCPDDGTMMFVERYDSAANVETWRCAQQGCERSVDMKR